MSVFHRVAASLMCAVLSCGLAVAQEKGKEPPKNPTFVVAQVGENLSVMSKADFDAAKKKAADDHAKAVEAYTKAKKAAADAKKEFKDPEPKMQVVEMKGAEHANKADAEAALKKLQDEAKKGKGGGGDAKGAEPHKK